MKKIIIALAICAIAPLLLMGAAGDYVSTVTKVNFALPRDINGIALHSSSLGIPTFSEAVTLTGTVAQLVLELPSTGNNANRQWRKLMVRNPDNTRVVYLCLVASAVCTTPNLKIPASTTLVLDDMYFGPMNSITHIYGKMDAAGSVVPEVTIW